MDKSAGFTKSRFLQFDTNAHCLITEYGVELFRKMDGFEKIHGFLLPLENLLEIIDSVDAVELKKFIEKSNDLPF